MRQRVMIAMALACGPKLLIADEPTTALDVTIQAQVMDLLRRVSSERQRSLLLVTHDLGLVAQMADRVAVMYAGRIVETAPVERIFTQARHPYTHGLLRSVPRLDAPREELDVIPGTVPDLAALPAGCAFHPRCGRASARCSLERPPVETAAPDHAFVCWNPMTDN
jgi:oligopeptide/dipeptide ABC transporter ATP-binding protein